jgi:cellulose synthase/poly-beta-1,6-N-acetylglucosamine synthase-like glycosyltransferase
MFFIIGIALIGAVFYTISLLVLMSALRKVRNGNSSRKPLVSVIIAAHDEKSTIVPCLESLKNQDYDPDLYEVIVSDDRSSDGTSDILDEIRNLWQKLRIIRIDNVPNNISPKKNALTHAIHESQGEIILETDADCVAPNHWISGMTSRFEPGVGMVTGTAPYLPRPGLLNSFIRHEYLWNAALSAGSIALGHGTHASGRNMGFRKDVFFALEGYGDSIHVPSGDDTLLLHRIQSSGLYQCATTPDRSTHVYTEAPDTFSSFIRQRLRHMSTGKYFEPFQIFVGGIIYSYHFFLILSFILSPFIRNLFFVFAASFFLKIILDWMIALRVQSVFKLDIQRKNFVLNEFFLLIYMTIIPLAGSLFSFSWKGKKY